MKRVMIIQALAAFCAFALLAGAVLQSEMLLALLAAAALVLQAAACFFLRRQWKVLQFLTEESRRRKVKDLIRWEGEDMEKLGLIRKRMDLSVLQEQINPHFLYNTLESIRSKALMEGQDEIAKMTEILSRFFRYCISSSERLVCVREELDHIRDYYYIQRYRFEDKLEMEFLVESEEIYDLYLPRMTLQPLVENAMVHGLERMEEQGRIEVRLFCTESELRIVISDNGVGMRREQLETLNRRMDSVQFDTAKHRDGHNGIALNNVNARLKITFGEEYGIHYRSMEGAGTDAVVALPIVDIFARARYEEG